MLYGLYWQEVFPWPTPEDETPECTLPVSGDYIAEVLDLEPGQALPYCFECLEGGRLDFAISSSFPIDLLVCTGDALEVLADQEFDQTTIKALVNRKAVQSASVSIRIPATDEYVVVILNPHEHPAPTLVVARPVDP